MSETHTDDRVVILNPVSGRGDHVDDVRDRAERRGYAVEQTEGEGDGIALAREAARNGSSVIAAAGGDGTLNEVLRGVDEADALDRVTLGVIPVGTGNNFARNVGIPDVDAAFDVLDEGERRQIDLGRANGRPFVNSCVGGLTADASGETTHEMKRRLGVLAYVVNTLRAVQEFDGLELSVTVWEDGRRTPAWGGEALCVLIGNGRRFVHGTSQQADMEDGLLDVVIVEDAPTHDLVGDAVVERLFGEDASNVTRLQAPAIEIESLDEERIEFSLDGEMMRSRSTSFEVERGALRLPVGDSYVPDPASDR